MHKLQGYLLYEANSPVFVISIYLDTILQLESAIVQDKLNPRLYTVIMYSSQPTILIIEPDKPTRELYERAISQQFQTVCASNEQTALSILTLDSIKAVILEPAGFGERGWPLLQTIRNMSISRHIPIILCSSWDERQRGLEMGASVYMTKPVLPTTLLQTLANLIFVEDNQ